MTMQDGWQQFWATSNTPAAYAPGGALEGVLEDFWRSFFKKQGQAAGPVAMLDIASGNGVVSRLAAANLPAASRLVGIDVSADAAATYARLVPNGHAAMCDAASMPFSDNSFDVVVSQFGLEYAGSEAILEVGRVLRGGGSFALILHHQEGGTYRECAANLAAVRSLEESGLLSATHDLFHAGPAAIPAAQTSFLNAAHRMTESLKALGENVAGGAILRLVGDCAIMATRARAYAPNEVSTWVSRNQHELSAFGARMARMCEVALDHRAAEGVAQGLRSCGLEVSTPSELIMGDTSPLPGAWSITGTKPLPSSNPP